MSPPETPRLLFVHAHPDDETLTAGGTIAHYVARGAEVHVVTCTLGEEGEVIGDRYGLLTVGHADQLGGYRIGELTDALVALGVDEPIYLGRPGRWRDSGMPPVSARRCPRFIDSGDDAVRELVAIIDRLRPHVVVTHDPRGGYGHPDHIHAHHVTTTAVTSCDWRVPKFYWTVLATCAINAGLNALADIPSQWIRLRNLGEMIGYADNDIGAVIDAREQLGAKVAALGAHATQVDLAPDRRSFALSNNIAVPVLSEEHYVLAAGIAGPGDSRGWETDLLAGLNVG